MSLNQGTGYLSKDEGLTRLTRLEKYLGEGEIKTMVPNGKGKGTVDDWKGVAAAFQSNSHPLSTITNMVRSAARSDDPDPILSQKRIEDFSDSDEDSG